jgi:hypothetical protein
MEAETGRVRKEVEVILELSGDEFRNVVLNNAQALAHEVKRLPEEARQRLIEVVQGAWPQDGVRANVERNENEIRFHDRNALAWLTLAPALDLSLSTEQWADVATCGTVMTDTADWLRRHYREDAAVRAARSCDSSAARPWSQLLSAIPRETRTPHEVIDAIVKHLAEPSTPEPDFELWQVGDRFVQEHHLAALQALSAKNNELDRRLRPWRARLGETEAARHLLKELTAALEEGKRFDRDEAEWLDGVADGGLLPQLFNALRIAIATEADAPFGVSSAIGRAIYRIGGDEAVRLYDNLIASSDDSRFKFLRLQRDEIVQAELRPARQQKSREVAERLNVPVLDPASETPEP